MKQTIDTYLELINAGVLPEDARFVLPNATCTSLIMTMNARSLFNFFEQRACDVAQWEIRNLAIEMLKLVKNVAPITFKNAGPSCISRNVCFNDHNKHFDGCETHNRINSL